MIVLICGASHTGKTALSQRLLERYHYPYLSIDHLKMGLIRSGNTDLTPMSDDGDLTAYLWPIVREMIKTAIENEQNYIRQHFSDIKQYASIIEDRQDDSYCTMEGVLEDNAEMLRMVKQHGVHYVLIDDRYEIAFDIDSEAEKNDT